MKKYLGLFAVILIVIIFCGETVFAGETCDYATDGTECEIWYFYNKESHWQACVNHKDVYGKDAAVSEEEAHTFTDGKCMICGAKEMKGTETMYYITVFIVVGIAGLFASARARSTFKNTKLEQTPFGLDKFKKH